MVLYNHNPEARDPTYYTNRAVSPDQVEPEGDKADASLMSELRSVRGGARREREVKDVQIDQLNNVEVRSREYIPDPDEERSGDHRAYYQNEKSFLGSEEPNEESC